ncbi:MAG TPA: hypothetical protein VLG16_02625 [Candidatus Saccharimonadales bacterium]|nr:hypothetical protein [Candidatus Saccharimonadales bacterium]
MNQQPAPQEQPNDAQSNFIVQPKDRLAAPELANYHGGKIIAAGTVIGIIAIGAGIGYSGYENHTAGNEAVTAKNERIAADQAYFHGDMVKSQALIHDSHTHADTIKSHIDASKVDMKLGWGAGAASIVFGIAAGGMLRRKQNMVNAALSADYNARVLAHVTEKARQQNQGNN